MRVLGDRPWRRAIPAAVVVAMLTLALLGWTRLSAIERVPLKATAAAGEGEMTNYLLVGIDSRERIDSDAPEADVFVAQPVPGARADAIIVLRRGTEGACAVSLPRDIWVDSSTGLEPGRLGLHYGDPSTGPDELTTAVSTVFDVPIHHYLEVDFTTVRSLVDALGGVQMDIERPIIDFHTGLELPEAGLQTIDGSQAVAYARSRGAFEEIDGQWVVDTSGDLGRTERQRSVLAALLSRVGAERRPWVLWSALNAATELRVDDQLSNGDLIGLARWLGGLELHLTTLEVAEIGDRGGVPVFEPAEGATSVLHGSCDPR